MNISASKIKIGVGACNGFKGMFYKGVNITDISKQLLEDMMCDNLKDLRDFVIDNNFGFNFEDFYKSETLQEACDCLSWQDNEYSIKFEHNEILFDIQGTCGFSLKYSFDFYGFENFTIDVEGE